MAQTNEEWLAEYDGKPIKQKEPHGETATAPPKTERFRYVDHRTTTMGSVVLEFESVDHKFVAVSFFNVGLKSTRGNNYSSGKRGQFNPPAGGKFRKFWMNTTGKAPTRWSRTHLVMRARFKLLKFTGETVKGTDRKGQPFTKLINVTAQ